MELRPFVLFSCARLNEIYFVSFVLNLKEILESLYLQLNTLTGRFEAVGKSMLKVQGWISKEKRKNIELKLLMH